ncbi:MAG: adenosylcobalamin-dependent ribonucleoside-diphosphate reductase, partial [Chloroflexi bacterium]|nr:adenosylcobalamin-dependent ribonucleoside-diphosphate reductase [Chloroflexota bacterium]
EDGKNLSNFNISVAVDKDFMERVKAGQEYDLVNPRTGKVTGQFNAKEVFELLTNMAWKTGDPGLIFLDLINRDNPNPQLGEIESTNPCGEQPLLPHESCNLASINVARMVTIANGDTVMNWERLDETVDIAVHMLDNVIDMNHYPIPEIDEMSKKTRRIGLGVMGFSDLLIQLGIRYDSEEALQTARDLMRRILERTHQASAELAQVRGTFPAWEGSIYNRPGSEGGVRPMRNSAPTTIAPTGTISIIAGASSGIEPLFALSYVRNVMDNTKLVEGNPYFEAVARQEGFYSEELMEDLARTGSLEGLDIPEWVKDVFRVSHDISPEWHVKMQGAVQEYIDNSVSKTINFPNDATVEDIAGAYMLAYELGCKGITVYRDGSKEGQVLSTGGSGQTGTEEAEVLTPRKRPQSIRGVTERVRTGHGNMYVTINFDEADTPFELFGNLGKAGGCDSAQLEAISRLVSLALRSGIEPATVIEQLRGITCCPAWDEGVLVRSGPDAVALALERHSGGGQGREESGASSEVQLKFTPQVITNGNGNGNGHVREFLNARKCPECNTAVIFEEGCIKCVACGWNKCE